MNMTAIEKRLKDLKRKRATTAKAESMASAKVVEDRLRRQAQNELAHEAIVKRQAAADKAVLQEIAEHAVKVVLEGSGLRVTINLSSPDMNTRLTARNAVALTMARLQRHEEARQGDARAHVLAGTEPQAATPEELAAFLSDEVRAAIKHGSLRIEIV